MPWIAKASGWRYIRKTNKSNQSSVDVIQIGYPRMQRQTQIVVWIDEMVLYSVEKQTRDSTLSRFSTVHYPDFLMLLRLLQNDSPHFPRGTAGISHQFLAHVLFVIFVEQLDESAWAAGDMLKWVMVKHWNGLNGLDLIGMRSMRTVVEVTICFNSVNSNFSNKTLQRNVLLHPAPVSHPNYIGSCQRA